MSVLSASFLWTWVYLCYLWNKVEFIRCPQLAWVISCWRHPGLRNVPVAWGLPYHGLCSCFAAVREIHCAMLELIDARFISCRCFSSKCIWHPSIAANLMSNIKWMFWCCTNESVVSPSSVRTDTLTDMVAHMREKVGLVHQMPFVCDRPGLPSTLEQVRYCITLKSLTWIGSTTKNLKGFNINSDRGKRVWIGSISIKQKVCHLLTLQNSHSVQICWHMRGAIPWSDYYEIWPTVVSISCLRQCHNRRINSLDTSAIFFFNTQLPLLSNL